jgi:hypothetical protein
MQLVCGSHRDSSTWCACAFQDSGAADEVAVRNADEPSCPGRTGSDDLVASGEHPMRSLPQGTSSCTGVPRHCIGLSVPERQELLASGLNLVERHLLEVALGQGSPRRITARRAAPIPELVNPKRRCGAFTRFVMVVDMRMVPAGAVVSRGDRAFQQYWRHTLSRLFEVEFE